MAKRMQWKKLAAEAGTAALTAYLSVAMAVPSAWAEAASGSKPGTAARAAKTAPAAASSGTKLTEHEKEMHALTRFTWGPRPGTWPSCISSDCMPGSSSS